MPAEDPIQIDEEAEEIPEVEIEGTEFNAEDLEVVDIRVLSHTRGRVKNGFLRVFGTPEEKAVARKISERRSNDKYFEKQHKKYLSKSIDGIKKLARQE